VPVGARNLTGGECWAKPLLAGGVAAVLLNRGEASAAVTCTWADVGVTGKATVRDLWAHKVVGTGMEGAYTATVPSHGVVMVTIIPTAAAWSDKSRLSG